MFTANTMAAAAEALGMSLPGSAVAAGGGPAPGGARGAQRRGRAGPARRRAHRPPDPDQGGVRERDRRGDGARRLHQRGAAPARDRARGPGRADPGRLQPGRRPDPAPGRRQAVRPVRDDRRRPDRRRPGGDEGAAGRRRAARRRAHRHRPHARRGARRDRPAGPGRQDHPRDGRPDPPHRRAHDPARLAGAGGRRGEERVLRVRGAGGRRAGLRRREGRDGGGHRGPDQGRATRW